MVPMTNILSITQRIDGQLVTVFTNLPKVAILASEALLHEIQKIPQQNVTSSWD